MDPNEGTGFEIDGTPVPTVDFDFDKVDADLAATPDDDPHLLKISPDDLAEMRNDAAMRAARKVLAILVDGGSARSIGCRALVLAHVLQRANRQTQRALARRCGYTPGRISQIVKAVRLELRLLNEMIRASNKAGA